MLNLTKKLLMLSAAAAFSFGMVACDDDSDSNSTKEDQKQEPAKVCTAGAFQCTLGGDVQKCKDDGSAWETVKTCDAATQTCNATKGDCDAKSDTPSTKKCDAGAYTCDSNALKKCKDDGSGWTLVEKCGSTKTCSTESKSCEEKPAECQETDASTCVGSQLKKCLGGQWSTISCDPGQTCVDGACKDDESTKVEETAIGKACTCLGDECSFTITSSELGAALTDSAKGFIPLAGAVIPGLSSIDDIFGTNDQIVAPNYFSAQAKTACADVKAPEGMTVGCFTTQTIDFSSATTLITFLETKSGTILDKAGSLLGLFGGGLGNVDLNAIDMNAAKGLVNRIAGLLKDGIKFKANKGYCMAATIDIDIDIPQDGTGKTIRQFINMDQVDTLLGKINTGDFSKVKSGDEYKADCGKGASLIGFGVSAETEGTGAANVGFAVCLKNCKTNDDCRTADGYSCVELESETGIKSVCFDKSNIDYFQKMTDDFNGDIAKITGETPEGVTAE